MTDIKGIRIDFIPHKDQNYDTVGNYFIDENGYLCICVSNMGSTKYQCLVAIHEFIEWFLTDLKGISEKKITEFDLMFEEERKGGFHLDNEEPGFDERAPYYLEHTLSTSVEMMLCAFAGIPWKDYDQYVQSL